LEAAAWTVIGVLAAVSIGQLVYLGAKIDALGARLDARIDGLHLRLDEVHGRLDRHIDLRAGAR
jgi:hypothetical protein